MRLLHGILAAGLLAGPYAHAECTNPVDQKTFDLEALKSQLMVLATGCHDADAEYNAFVNKYKGELGANEKAFSAYFKRAYGRNGQREQDAYVTNLANAQSEVGMKQGTDFCPRNAVLFHEVMSLQGDGDLPLYAAGKDLIPDQLGACETAPVPTRAAATSSGHKKRH